MLGTKRGMIPARRLLPVLFLIAASAPLAAGPMTALSMSERYRTSKAPWRILPARNYPA